MVTVTDASRATDPLWARDNAVTFMVDERVIARYEEWARRRQESAPDLMRMALEDVIQHLESGQIQVLVFNTGNNVQQAVMISAANIAERYKAYATGAGYKNECDLMRYALDMWHPPAN